MAPPLLSLNLNTPNAALQIAHILLEYGADVNAAMPASTTLPETAGDTALLNLCRQLAFIDVSSLPQIRDLVNLFIKEGADVNHQNAAGETPLMACCRGMLLGDDSLDRLKLGYCASSAGPPRKPIPERQIRTHSPPEDRQPVKRTSPDGAEIPAGIKRSTASEEGKPLNPADPYFTRAFTVSSRMPASGWDPVLMKWI